MTKSLEALIADMKAAAEKATPGEWRRTSTQFNGITATPFTLGGIEKVLAHTVEKSDAEFITQANPTNVLALIAALVQAQKSNSFLKEQLAQLANFNPDWDKLEACQESWREVSTELNSAQSHIAELESLCVNPDATMRGVEPLCVKLPGGYTVRSDHPIYEGERSVMIPKEGGNWLSRLDVEHVLRVAGVQFEGGE